nr:gliding motility-associated ABC transporter permease subunit GldF [Galbibacter mesophilus]
MVIGLFLILNGLFLWVFQGDFNIFESGFADMNAFFQLTPWILIFLIPAVTMKSFSEEKKSGTLELLLTRPISKSEIVFGKFFGSYILILIAVLPTILYVLTINTLANPTGSIDYGPIVGGYFGLLFLMGVYTSVGVFISSLTDNQIIAFVAAALVCFLLYFGFSGFSEILPFSFIEKLSLKYHFDSIGRGVIDIRDIIYFKSVSLFFIVLTIFKLK